MVLLLAFGFFKVKAQSNSNKEIKLDTKTETLITPKGKPLKRKLLLLVQLMPI